VPRPPTASPERILAVAALEFAEHGFAGARVDRLARRARVNKAMIYYHFGSKQGLYRTLLRDVFGGAAAWLREIGQADLPSAVKVERLVEAMGEFIGAHRFFPAIMMREVADGGVHLDRQTLKALAAVPLAVAAVVQEGVGRQALRPVHPIAAYFTMFAPVLMFFAGAPIRQKLAAGHLVDMNQLASDRFIAELRTSIRLALAAPGSSR
jgi:TetR/AcrR family transcriptional regulator